MENLRYHNRGCNDKYIQWIDDTEMVDIVIEEIEGTNGYNITVELGECMVRTVSKKYRGCCYYDDFLVISDGYHLLREINYGNCTMVPISMVHRLKITRRKRVYP